MSVTTEPDGGNAVSVHGLTKSYRRLFSGRAPVRALRECEFSLPAGKVAALVGANGAGKSTLLTILAGLLHADSGVAHAMGRTAFVSQDKALYRHLDAAEMLRLIGRLNEVWDERIGRDWLARFAVPLDRPCGKLSGGQRTQVAFALALSSRPDVLLLDEPLSNLDPLVRREVMTELLGAAAESGMTVLLSTHIVTELGGVADHLLLLANGRLLVDGDLDELLQRHVSYTGPAAQQPPVPGEVVQRKQHDGQSSFLIRLPEPAAPPEVARPWVSRQVSLEELVLAYLAEDRGGTRRE